MEITHIVFLAEEPAAVDHNADKKVPMTAVPENFDISSELEDSTDISGMSSLMSSYTGQSMMGSADAQELQAQFRQQLAR